MTDAASKACRECGQPFVPARRGKTQVFCGLKCRRAAKNRRLIRGYVIYGVLLDWRRTKGKSISLSAIWSVLDKWIKEDRDHEKDNRARAAAVPPTG